MFLYIYKRHEKEDKKMGYSLFAQRKLVLSGLINSVQMQQTQRGDEQLNLSTKTLSLQSQITNIQTSQARELSVLYNDLASADGTDARSSINNLIESRQAMFDSELTTINNQIYQTSIKENAIEMEVKRLDTKLTALQKILEKTEEAESKGIEKSIPNFNGLG